MDWLIEIVKNMMELGLIYALVSLGVYMASYIIKFDDLSIEGSFAFGGAITTLLFIKQVPSFFTVPMALVAGALIGMMTGLLHTKLGINNLISGIVVTAALFSINLKLVGPNYTLCTAATIFDVFNSSTSTAVMLAVMVTTVFLVMHWLLQTEVGLLFKTVGSNAQMLTNLGKSVHGYKIAGLMIANALSALAGSLFVQHMKFFSITGSIGTMVIALAGCVVGVTLFRSAPLVGLVGGALLYQLIVTTTIELQFDPAWNKLIASIFIICLLLLRQRNNTIAQTWR